MNQPLKAIARNGRLIMNVPTDLPDGKEVEVVLVESYEDVDFAEPWMDAEEANAFNEEMRASLMDIDAGRVIDGDVFLAELRARAEAS